MIRAVVLAIALVGVTFHASARAEGPAAPIGIAPLDQDLEAMSDTMRRLEALINARDPEALESLISPEVPSARRRGMVSLVRRVVESLPAEGRYLLRTDIGRGALVPVGPGRMQVQVRGTTIVGEERRGESVRLSFVPREQSGRRRWLLTSLEFPRLQATEEGGESSLQWAAAVGIGVGAVALIGAVVILLRRRRQRRRPEAT